ncbi:MAG: DsbA family protein [Candidatus Binataceae bacterium]
MGKRVSIASPGDPCRDFMMARIVVPIYFDYASTLCYIAWRIVRELEPQLDFQPLWKGVPIALRDHRTSAGRTLTELERQKVLMVAAETGIPVAPPREWIDSTAALEGSEVARDAGVFVAYHDAVFRAAFQERADIAQPAVLDSIAERAGMDRALFRADLNAHRMATRIDEYRREADEFSAFGYPTFILGDYPMIGIQPASTMRLVLARFIQQRQTEPQA